MAKSENAVFLKLEPMVEDREVAKELSKAGFIRSTKEVQPQRTIVLDITKPEEELLAQMHEKTRYNVRLASRMPNVKFQMSDAVDGFWELVQKTAQRDRFSTHTKEYYKKLLELNFVKLFIVQYGERIIAANIVLFYGECAVYLHGASDYKHRNLMAPYLLHWETIKYAKEQGYKKYDLWGVDEKKWPGVTRFKKGFRGRGVEYVGSYDYIFQPFWYKLYNLRGAVKRIF
ncbi:MAG: peptidoglycan bridge formation glycyltransferase FemA/FemB family protein [Candidatus Spechtbacterales bacterium]